MPPAESTEPPWGSAAWRQDARQWASARLRDLGTQTAGPMADVSVQAWSAVWRIPTTHGPVILKQTSADRVAEFAIHDLCARLAPEFVDKPLAIDIEGRRILLPDGGPTVHDEQPAAPPVGAVGILQDYARLQRATIGHHAEVVSTGSPHWHPASAADELEELAHALHALPTSDLRHVTAWQRDALLRHRPAYALAGQTLAASRLPSCLDHGDLWPGNVLVPARNGHYRFIDFGDAAWSHPMLSLQPFLRYHQQQWAPAGTPFDLGDRRLAPLIDAYVDAWSNGITRADAHVLVSAAAVLSPLRRARALLDNFEHAGVKDKDDLGPTPWDWLTGAGQAG